MNVNSEEESFVFIYPKRLVMIQSNLCDLCTKIHKENTYVTEMIYRFGYQHCNNCREICQKHISLYCNYNNIFPTIQFCDRFDIKYNQKFIVQRSSGKMEENWFISTEDFIKFNGDISNWNVTNVKNMKGMFYNAIKFNVDISSWNPSKCEYFGFMFYNATSFNRDLSSWTARIPTTADPTDGNDGIFTGSPLASDTSKQFTIT